MKKRLQQSWLEMTPSNIELMRLPLYSTARICFQQRQHHLTMCTGHAVMGCRARITRRRLWGLAVPFTRVFQSGEHDILEAVFQRAFHSTIQIGDQNTSRPQIAQLKSKNLPDRKRFLREERRIPMPSMTSTSCLGPPEKVEASELTHITSTGEAHMVDVGSRKDSKRIAIARSYVRFSRIAILRS